MLDGLSVFIRAILFWVKLNLRSFSIPELASGGLWDIIDQVKG